MNDCWCVHTRVSVWCASVAITLFVFTFGDGLDVSGGMCLALKPAALLFLIQSEQVKSLLLSWLAPALNRMSWNAFSLNCHWIRESCVNFSMNQKL